MQGIDCSANTAVMTAVAAIDADMETYDPRASGGLARRLMTIPGVGQLTALAFVAAIDDPSRIRRSRDVGAYLGLVPRRHQSGEVDYVGSISKCGGQALMRTLLYEAANVMLTRYKGQLKLKDWAFAIAEAINDCAQSAKGRSGAPPQELSCVCDAARRDRVRIGLSTRNETGGQIPAPQEERRPREGADDGADFVARGHPMTDCDFSRAALRPAYPIKRRTSTQRTQAPESVDTRRASALDDVDGPTVGASSAERWSLERHQEGGRPCGNISELASTSPRIPFKSTRWRAKIVPPRNVN